MISADLIAFEAEIAERFNRGEIRSPVHLSGGNETQLIDYFARAYRADRGDWVVSTWRSHYHCLLAGVPPDEVRAAILAGRSITLTFPEHRFVSSAIVGGGLPIAVGLALRIKRQQDIIRSWVDKEVASIIYKESARVHCFVGDMAARTGAYAEARRYASGHGLPVTFVVEDNGVAVLTDTQEVWGRSPFIGSEEHYEYRLGWPHAGAGVRVEF